MDELDLVRLTRPAVDEPGADALARLKAAALDTPTPATAVPPGGTSCTSAERKPVPRSRRRRWSGVACPITVSGVSSAACGPNGSIRGAINASTTNTTAASRSLIRCRSPGSARGCA